VKKISLIFLIGFVLLSCSYASISKIDSLSFQIKNSPSDSNKVNTLLQLAELYYEVGYPDSCLYFSEKAYDLATEIHFINGMVNALNNIGTIIGSIKNDSYIGFSYFEKALNLYADNPNKSIVASVYHNRGYQYQLIGQLDKALKDYIKSYQLRLAINDELGEAFSLNQIGWIYGQQNNYEKAIEAYNEALVIQKKINNDYQVGILYNNIGAAFDKMGLKDSAIVALQKSKEIRIRINDMLGLGYVYNNIGALYRDLNITDSAYHYFQLSLTIREELEQPLGIVYSLINLAQLKMIDNQLNDAEQLCLRALEIADKNHLRPQLQLIYEKLAYIYEQEKLFKLAYEYAKLNASLKDSLFNESKSKEIGKLEATYEMEKKQAEEDRLRQEQERIEQEEKERRDNIQYSLIFLGILTVFGSILGLGFIKVSPQSRWLSGAEGLIFFAFLIFFEFCLVILDPYIDDWSSGEPIYKLLFNAVLAGGIFPLHAFFEQTLKKRLIISKRNMP
jgi:two-component system, NarL family, sensor kinase